MLCRRSVGLAGMVLSLLSDWLDQESSPSEEALSYQTQKLKKGKALIKYLSTLNA